MKSLFLKLVMVLMVGVVYAGQPARKPFIQINIDGKSFKNGDILAVKPGQKLLMGVEFEGGRRDFCKFPDTYSDIAGTAQILSRGDNGLTYELNGTKAEWKLLKETFQFLPDDFIKANATANQSSTELIVSNVKFSQSVVKVNVKAVWQFSQSGQTKLEENTAEGTVYFKIAGASDVWYSSQNIQAGGIQNDIVQEKLVLVQSSCDSIEKNLFHLKFSAVQQAIRNLQSSVNALKSTIDEVKASNATYQTKVTFVGIPSDNPFKDIEVFSSSKASWDLLEPLVNDLKQQLGKLPGDPTKESKDELIKIISLYAGWQNKLPENIFQHLLLYIPEINVENMQLPKTLYSVAQQKAVPDYSQTVADFNAFLDQRIQQVPDEIQKISSTHSRLQAVRLFDGMLRSYFSSISWAEWKNTRE